MKKLYIDFDGTIVNTIKAIVKLYNDDFMYYKDYKYINWTDINTWNFTECNCTTPDYINTYFNQQRFFDSLEFMDNAEDILLRLSKKHEITIVSMGYSPNLRGKAIWIEKNIPYAKFIGVNFKEHTDKAHIDMSNGFYIDDNEKNLNTNAKEKICFGEVYEWNSKWNGKRFHNWTELEKYLEEVG